jgi:peptidoglycan hydrolase-like amidase
VGFVPTWGRASLSIALLVASSVSSAQDVRVGVLGLFRPTEMTVSAVPTSAIVVRAGEKTFVIEKSSGAGELRCYLAGQAIVVETRGVKIQTSSLNVTSRENGAADFSLAIPGKISRRYRGTLRVEPISGVLLAVISMDLETATASVVAAESAPDAPIEALKAQAVVARSYLLAARGRHVNFDFCDTTHCQYLRNPPAPDTPAGRAAAETRGLVLTCEAGPVAAMYTRSCDGHTRTPVEVGLAAGGYPYYSIACKYCQKHPARWQSKIAVRDAGELRPSSESGRLEIDRLLGWSAVPSNSFSMRRESDHVLLQGIGQGHGIGMCQAGAAAMAKEGATFLQILTHYYPNTAVVGIADRYAKR